MIKREVQCKRTFLFIYPQNDHNFVPSNTDKLLDRSYTSPRKLREQYHSLYVVIFELCKQLA